MYSKKHANHSAPAFKRWHSVLSSLSDQRTGRTVSRVRAHLARAADSRLGRVADAGACRISAGSASG